MSPRLPVATSSENGQILGVRCPRCKVRTRVIDTVRLDNETNRRRHLCPACGARFSTDERIDDTSIAY